MNGRKKYVEAYFTVEASLVLPVVIGSVIFVICFLLFFYDRCLMEQDVAMISIRASQSQAQSPEELEKELVTWRQQYLAEKEYAWEMSTIVMSRKQNRIEFEREGKLLMGERVWTAKVTGSALELHPASILRLCRRIYLGLEEKG